MSKNFNLQLFKNVKGNNGQYTALCPAHDDNNASLSIKIANNQVLLHCHAGCSTESIVSTIGLSMSELFLDEPTRQKTDKKKKTNTITYEYHAADGSLAYNKQRYEFDDGSKTFAFFTPNGEKGRGEKSYPYNLPAILKAETVYFCEGEKCVDAITKVGQAATSLDAGANSKWLKEYNAYFKGKRIIILPDNDEPGMIYANKIARELPGSKIVRLPDLQKGGDIYDWLKQGRTMQEIDALPTEEPTQPNPESQQEVPPLVWFNDVQKKDIDWYWYPYIRRGALNSIVATQGTGKSYLMCKVAAMASVGKRHELPLHDRHNNYHPFGEPETTLYLNAEDDPEEDTKLRLELCGADVSKIATVNLSDINVNFYNPCIEEWIKQAKPSMLVFDPVQQFFTSVDPHGKPLDMNDSSSVRPALTHLKMLAKKYNVAIVLIMHPNKSILNSALYAAMGSNDFTAAPRSALFIGRDPEDKERRVITITKANSVPDKDQISYTFKWDTEKGGIYFDGETDLQADDIRETRRKARNEFSEPTKKETAIEWLENLLDENGGYMKFSDIEKQRKETDITHSTLHRAKNKCRDFIKDTGKGQGKITYWYIVGYEPPEQLTFI